MLDHSTLATRLQGMLNGMPPVRAMGVTLLALDESGLRLAAPLSRNVNDKACAFGGSLAGILTLAGWGVLASALWRRGIHAEVYVAESQIQYLAPLYGDLVAEAAPPTVEALATLLERIDQRGRGSLWLDAEVRGSDGAVAARLHGRYAALRSD